MATAIGVLRPLAGLGSKSTKNALIIGRLLALGTKSFVMFSDAKIGIKCIYANEMGKKSHFLQNFIVFSCVLQKIVVSLHRQKQRKDMNKLQLTEAEEDLIRAIRNYNKTYPDGYPELLWLAEELFNNMLRQPYK